MTTKSTHTYFDQEMIIEQSDVILRLHDPLNKTERLPLLKMNLGQLLDDIAFMFQGKLTGEDFLYQFTRKPIPDFCNNCPYYKTRDNEMFSYCDAFSCIRAIKEPETTETD